jgi:hypothetical protein
MRYETPEVTALTPAINAIQAGNKISHVSDNPGNTLKDPSPAYADWEE